MLAIFCLRLSCGLAGALVLLLTAPINARFFRAHLLAVLGLTAAAAYAGSATFTGMMWLAVSAAMLAAFLGSLAWSLEGAPAGRIMIVAAALALTGALVCESTLNSPPDIEGQPTYNATWQVVDNLASAALLGAATTAMLVGHSYLIAPSMALAPLFRLLSALFVAIGVRGILAGIGLWSWTRGHSLVNLEDETVLWLPLRWGLGLVAPFILGWMAWQTTRIRSTQSATGILYVVVIFCFLGELTSQLLWRDTGMTL